MLASYQTIGRDGHRSLGLVGSTGSPVVSPYFRTVASTREKAPIRNINLFLLYNFMAVNRAVIRDLEDGGYPNWFAVAYFMDGTTNAVVSNYGIGFSINNSLTAQDIISAAENAVTNYATSQGYSLSAGILWPFLPTPVARTFTYPTLAVNTARQVSVDTFVVASVEVDAALSLSGGAKGTVSLQYADNNTFTTNLKTAGVGVNGNTGTLTIGLNTTQAGGGVVVGIIPAGKYYRLFTTNTTGTPTFGTPVIEEVTM